MKLTKKSTVQDIFDQFNTQFPYLHLEFYDHDDNVDHTPTHQISHSTLLEDLNPELVESVFAVDPEMTVSDFEKMMEDKYQLNIQVFRKSSDIWLQTSATDHWTLEKQNGKGHRSTLTYDIDPITISDFDVE
jgi:hypothetical protein